MAVTYELSYTSRLAVHRHVLWTDDQYAIGEVPVPEVNEALFLKLHESSFNRDMAPLKYGRFYPAQILQIPMNLPADMFRVTRIDGTEFTADFNHPLAGKEIALKHVFHQHENPVVGKPDMLLEWAGIEASLDQQDTDFSIPLAYDRADPSDDEIFYATPRKVLHLDPTCASRITALYSELIKPNDSVLDLMSSWRSHLPAHAKTVTGLGMNEGEMTDNPQLSSHIMHNLNRSPRLPFNDGLFHAVINTVSVEYLTDPHQVFADVRRVLKPGGLVIVTFSTRYFPPKAARFWTELHPAERLGWVLQLLHSAGFSDLHCHVERGLMRSPDDRYANQVEDMDPLFAAWGKAGVL